MPLAAFDAAVAEGKKFYARLGNGSMPAGLASRTSPSGKHEAAGVKRSLLGRYQVLKHTSCVNRFIAFEHGATHSVVYKGFVTVGGAKLVQWPLLRNFSD
jgi:hypothetical protein